jgi:hypothetical protein
MLTLEQKRKGWNIVWLLGLRQVVVKSELSSVRRLSEEGSYTGFPTSSRFYYMTHYMTYYMTYYITGLLRSTHPPHQKS